MAIFSQARRRGQQLAQTNKRRMVTYGQKGLRRGVPKDLQQRHAGGGPGSGPILTQPPGGWQYDQGQGTGGNPYNTGWNQGNQGAQAQPDPTAAYLAKLKAAGLVLGNGGKIQTRGYGSNFTDEQMKLAQLGYNRFGLTNGMFDPTRVGYRAGETYNLGTGTGSSDAHNVVNDAVLQRLRERAGWTPEAALANSGYNANSGQAFQSLEMYQRYLDAARANAQLNAGGQVTNPNAQALLDAGTIRTDVEGAVPSYTNPTSGTRPPASQQPTPTTDQNKVVPTPAQQTQAENVKNMAEKGFSTPQQSIAGGVDPSKHAAYWATQGWQYNPATTQWTQTGAQHQAGAASPQMPLDPQYIAAQRLAQQQLNSTLQSTYPALEQIGAQQALANARLGTNAAVDQQALLENLAGRGAFNSSLRPQAQGDLATNYLRQYQDLAAEVANAQSGVYQTQQQAYNDYYAQLIEAMLASANASATSRYTPVGNRRRKPKPKNKKKKGGRRA